MSNIKIQNISHQQKFSYDLAVIHKENYPKSHFSSHIPITVLNDLYFSYFRKMTIYLATFEDENCGFIIGGDKSHLNYNFSFRCILSIISTYLQNPKFGLKKLFIPYMFDASSMNIPNFRIFSICVVSKFSKKGIGRTLLNTIENEFRSKSIQKYGLSVKYFNKEALLFYLKNHFNVSHVSGENIYLDKHL